jgi:hypothetical protein
MSVQIRRLDKKNLDKFLSLIQVFEEVFEMKGFKMPCEKYLQALLAKEDFFVFVALLEEKVVGGLTAYTLQQY